LGREGVGGGLGQLFADAMGDLMISISFRTVSARVAKAKGLRRT
jgi:hypothetical protein